jgi:hypothetical protein
MDMVTVTTHTKKINPDGVPNRHVRALSDERPPLRAHPRETSNSPSNGAGPVVASTTGSQSSSTRTIAV